MREEEREILREGVLSILLRGEREKEKHLRGGGGGYLFCLRWRVKKSMQRGEDRDTNREERIQEVVLFQSESFFGGEFTTLDPQKKEPVPEGALRRGTSDYDSQDSKSHNSQKQKQVASDDDGGNGIDGVGSSSSGSSSQSR